MAITTGHKTVRAFSTYGAVWKTHPDILVGKPEAKKPLGDPGVNRIIILKWI
jgi:hypothetical protein